MIDAYIGLGSNLGDSRAQVLGAIVSLGRFVGTRIVALSRLYRTPPWGLLEQPDFVNAAVWVQTTLTPRELLDGLLAIERAAGRIRHGERWGPRVLDLDLLHVSGVTHNDENLVLPHPHIAERAFVLAPLADIAPVLVIPGQGVVSDLLAAIDSRSCQILP